MMIAAVQIGNANIVTRIASRSRFSADGTRSSTPLKRKAPLDSSRAFSRYRIVAAPATVNDPVAVIAAVTWMAIQYEFSAGLTGPTESYSQMFATPSAMTAANMTGAPRKRALYRIITTMKAVTAAKEMAVRNSYMLPHGH